MKRVVLVLCSFIITSASLLPQDVDPSLPAGACFGQKPPGVIPEVFAPAMLSGGRGSGGVVFSRSGDEVFFFSVSRESKYSLRHSTLADGHWGEPQLVFPASGNSAHPFFSADGRQLFFGSDRRIQPDRAVPYYGIWVSTKAGDEWSAPVPVAAPINTGYENCGSFSVDGQLYFRRVSPSTRGDIFQSDQSGGVFGTPVKLPAAVNTAHDESHPAISPDGSYLVFSSKRPGRLDAGSDELWVSFRQTDGQWSKARNLGKKINAGGNTSSATISPDGRYMFFVRIEGGIGIAYWVSTRVIEELREDQGRSGSTLARD